jgi:hypothetical protein
VTTGNRELAAETAEALLNAIKEAAPDAHRRSTDGLESLAKAYAAVVDAMPRDGGKSSGRAIVS